MLISAEQSDLPNDQLSLMYCDAITAYLNAVYQEGSAGPDTLFIGKHDQFPEISLPLSLRHSMVQLIPLEETERLRDRQGTVLLNIVAQMNDDQAEFLLVRFNQGFRPQHNCLIDFRYNEHTRKYDLSRMHFEYPYPDSIPVQH